MMLRLLPLMLLLFSPFALAETSPLTSNQAELEVMSLGNVLQMLLGLIVVLLVIFGSAWMIKRLGRWQGALTDEMKVLGGLPLGARERIVLVQVGKQQLLIGMAPGTIRTLHVLEEPIEVAQGKGLAQTPLAEKFATILKKQKTEQG